MTLYDSQSCECEQDWCVKQHVAYDTHASPAIMSHLGPLEVVHQAKVQQGLPDLLHHETRLRVEGRRVHFLRNRAGCRDGVQGEALGTHQSDHINEAHDVKHPLDIRGRSLARGPLQDAAHGDHKDELLPSALAHCCGPHRQIEQADERGAATLAGAPAWQ